VEKLSEDTLVAVGRMTVAAIELEAVLAGLAGERAEAVFTQPGGALQAAREATAARPAAREIRDVRSAARELSPGRDAAAGHDEEMARLVEAAATQLAVSHRAVRAMWRGGRTDAALFDEISALLLGCAERLQAGVH
jgi:hypothetical protein